MSFASPIWLWLLVPWALVAAWLLVGRREQARVPFLHLWPTGATRTRVDRSLRPPPLALVCLLLAMLLAILAAAGPRAGRGAHRRAVTLVVDLGPATPARELSLWTVALGSADVHPARVVLVPGGELDAGRSSLCARELRQATMSSLDTLPALRAAAQDALLRDRDRPVLVLSHRRLGIADERLIQVGASGPIHNVGLVRLAARERPTPQVMVMVRNASSHAKAELLVTTDGHEQRQSIDLPARGAEATHFVDLRVMGRVISAELVVEDDFPCDNRAWLVLQRAWPRVEARVALPAELTRMIDSYAKLRPPGEGSTRVVVASEPVEDTPAAAVATDAAALQVQPEATLAVEEHPVNAELDWTRMARDARVAPLPAGEWRPIVSRGGHALVAVREAPHRQVWVGVSSEHWPREGGYVIFWTNVFDWLGGGRGGGETFAGEPARELGDGWRRSDELSGAAPLPLEPAPGVWLRQSDGARRALNVIDLDLALEPAPASDDWRGRLARLDAPAAPPRPAAAAADLSKPALVAALALALIASLTWASVKRAPEAA